MSDLKRGREKKTDIQFVLIAGVVLAIFVALSILFRNTDSSTNPIYPDTAEESEINVLCISELMSNNGGVYMNASNEICDYLELYNGTSRDINLSGYGLSDRTDQVKWTFPDVVLPSHGYIVVSLTGEMEDGLTAPFRLSSKGDEEIILLNASSKIIDAVKTVSLRKNETMMRDATGEWIVSSYGTPGFANSKEGLDAYLNSLIDTSAPEIVINEMLLRNEGNFKNEFGSYDGYIEFKNVSDHAVDLGTYVISNTEETPFLTSLQSRFISPGECYSYYIGKENTEGYLGINLASKNGTVILSKEGKIAQKFSYSDVKNGMALIRCEDGSYEKGTNLSMNEDNTVEGTNAFQSKYMGMPQGLIISEIMPQNDSYLAHNGDRTYDWIELYNNSNEVIHLSEYSFNQDLESAQREALPQRDLNPGEYVAVMCSGNSMLSTDSYPHLNFKLSDEDSVILYHNNEPVDSVFYSSVPYGYSYGRGNSYGFYYFETPTPLTGNGSGMQVISNPPAFSVTPGVYDDVSEVVVELTGNGAIHYTLDGSIPDDTDPVYDGPLHLAATTVVKAKNYLPGAIPSKMNCASYIINEHHTLPVMSVSLNPSFFNDLNWNPNVVGLERAAYAELYEDGSSFSIPCSMACFGGNTRSHRKKSYALRFNDQWGEQYLEYPLFDKRDNSIYESLVLRTGSNDWDVAYMRDILMSELIDGTTNVDVQAYKTVVLYINGQYWGLYNIREKINTAFFSEHYNIPKDDMNILRIDYDVTAGSYSAYNRIREYANTHSMANEEYYNELCKMIDIDNFIDYWICQSFITNNDIVNCRFWNSPYFNDGKFRWIMYDVDLGWYNIYTDYYLGYMVSGEGIGRGTSFENDILRSVFNSPLFRQRWLERMSVLMKNVWNADHVIETINNIHDAIYTEMPRNQERWGLTMEEWEENVEYLREFARKRENYFLRTTQNYFSLSNSEMKELFDGLW